MRFCWFEMQQIFQCSSYFTLWIIRLQKLFSLQKQSYRIIVTISIISWRRNVCNRQCRCRIQHWNSCASVSPLMLIIMPRLISRRSVSEFWHHSLLQRCQRNSNSRSTKFIGNIWSILIISRMSWPRANPQQNSNNCRESHYYGSAENDFTSSQ